MSFTLGMAQTTYPADGDVLSNAHTVARRASHAGASILAFPENLMCPHELTSSELRGIAQPLCGSFVQGMRGIARTTRMWLVFTFCEVNPAGGPPFNSAVVADATGSVRATYRKCHLYDAHGVSESERMTAGQSLCPPIRTPFCTLGVGICYDLRFPELSRSLALEGCDLLLFPAAWHDGQNKPLHWKTLLRARAIENECFVAGICHADQRYVGTSHAFDPLGNELISGSDELLLCEIDPDRVHAARDVMPIFSHRRPKLYDRLCER